MESCRFYDDTGQKKITDYFLTQPVPTPLWIKRMCANAKVAKGHKTLLATIADLPEELLLLILNYICLDDRVFYNHARKLSRVCKRFHQVFAPLALENVYCAGILSILGLEAFIFGPTSFPREVIKSATFVYEELEEEETPLSTKPLLHLLPALSGLTKITIYGFSVKIDHLIALGKLCNLTSLTYDHAAIPQFCDFGIEDLERSKHLFPNNLKAVSFTLSDCRHEYSAMLLLRYILSASANSLDSLVIDIQIIFKAASLDDLFEMHFSSLSSITIYSYNPRCSNFLNFRSRHFPHLQKVEFLLYLVYDETIPQVTDIPGLEGAPTGIPALNFAILMRNQGFDVSETDENIAPSNLVVEELAIQRGPWMMLETIAQAHPSIRVLNAWDFLDECDAEDFNPEYCSISLDDLIEASPYLQNLEVLRFNTDETLSDDCDSKRFPFCVICCASNCVCNPLEHLYCKHRILSDIEDPVQRILQWEQDEQRVYNYVIFELLKYLPKLRLVEWFLVPYALGRRTHMFAPYWSWKIHRKEPGEKPTVLRTLHDANFQPLDRPPIRSLTRGFSLPSSHKPMNSFPY